MGRRIVQDSVIPAGYGQAFEVRKGQVLRIHAVEDGQVGDCCFFNANDYKEWFHVGQTWSLNVVRKTGNGSYYTYFYSKPPRENLMFTVLEDTTKRHFALNGGRCSKRLYEFRNGISEHRSCQGNLEEALAPYGITGDDIGDIFNVFMEVDLQSDGDFQFTATNVKKGDYIDLLAEMDVLAGISACPSDVSATNHFSIKPLGVQILE